MPTPILYATNVLEGAVFTLTPEGPAAGRGVERLADRDIGIECEDQGVAGTRTWAADRGLDAPTPTVDAWVLAGAGYAGETLTLESSSDGASWTPRGTVTPTADTPQRVAVTPFAVPRYVRWRVTDPAVPVRLTEVTLAPGTSLTFPPTARYTREPTIPNVTLRASQSGRGWGVQRGARRWSTLYTLLVAPETDRTALYALLDTLQDGVKPCWLVDVQGVLRWVRLSGEIILEAAQGLPTDHWTIPLNFVEELP